VSDERGTADETSRARIRARAQPNAHSQKSDYSPATPALIDRSVSVRLSATCRHRIRRFDVFIHTWERVRVLTQWRPRSWRFISSILTLLSSVENLDTRRRMTSRPLFFLSLTRSSTVSYSCNPASVRVRAFPPRIATPLRLLDNGQRGNCRLYGILFDISTHIIRMQM